jgi:hypothetical protein
MLGVQELKDGLAQFYGTEQYHQWSALYPHFYLTDGAKYLADNAECYWLMDIIGSWQSKPWVRQEFFQVWKLKKVSGGWLVECEDGDYHTIASQRVELSDFPLEFMRVYAIYTGVDLVILLPGEY